MKLLTVAIPCYNSQDYMVHAVESLLAGGENVEILIIDDGSLDQTAAIADDYERKYPQIIRAIHQPNAGHGGAVMAGIENASGLYFKVVDSDDWVDETALKQVLQALKAFRDDPIDMLITNYVYDKVGVKRKHVVRYTGSLPQGRVFGWDETKRFPKGHYMLMHAIIYRTQLLRECGLSLPKHTFYVDMLYAYVPIASVERMYYLNANLYHYFIGREGQSVQDEVLTRRIDQYIRVDKQMISALNPISISCKRKQAYLISFLEIAITVVSTILIKSGTPENLQKKHRLWQYIQQTNPALYNTLRHRAAGRLMHLNGKTSQIIIKTGYKLSNVIFGFN